MAKEYGFIPHFVSPDSSPGKTEVFPTESKYASARGRFTTMIKARGERNAGFIPFHALRCFLPILGCKSGMSRESRPEFGHWSLVSNFPERHNRFARVDEPRLRPNLLTKLSNGWIPAPPL